MTETRISFVCLGSEQGQKCWLNPLTLSTNQGKLSDFIHLFDSKTEYICQAWTSDRLHPNIVNLSPLVSRNLQKDCSNKSSSTPMLKVLKTKDCHQVHITLVIKDYRMVKQIRQDLLLHPGKVENLCRNMLYKVCFAENFSINVSNNYLADVYGIASIIFNSGDKEDCEAWVIGHDSKVIINKVISKERLESHNTHVNIGGIDAEAEELCHLLKIPFQCNDTIKSNVRNALPKGILLRGPPGTGKTTLVKHVANLCGAYVITVNGPEVFGARPGETEENLSQILDKTLTLAEEGPTILFLDEVDTLCPNQLMNDSSQEVNCTQMITQFFDRITSEDNLVVIGATNRATAVDRALRRPGRFDKEIMVNIPNLSQRLDIIKKLSLTLPLAKDVDLDKLAYMTNGYVGADLVAVTREAAMMAMLKDKMTRQIDMKCFEQAVHKVMPSIKKGTIGLVELSPVYWSQIGGLSDVKLQIQQAVEWPMKHPEAFERMGLPCPKGVLLYGPPGCCKTTLVRAAATAANATFISLSGAQLYSPYIGDSERMISEVFQKARAAAPSILFLDELDSIVGKRSDGNRGVQERVLSTLLNEMDGIGTRLDDKIHTSEKVLDGDITDDKTKTSKQFITENRNVLLVAATNRPDLVDDALIRPGRIDRILYVPPPDKEARLEILKVYTEKMPVKDVDIKALSEGTEFFSGADLQSLCREAALLALTEDIKASHVTMVHFNQALDIVDPTLTQAVINQYKKISK